MGIVIALLAALGLGTGATVFIIRNLLYICQPSEVLIFAGGRRSTESGREVGYRLVKGGRSIRKPLLERAFQMDLTNMIIELKVSNAYSKGGIPLQVDGVANIKIAGSEPTIHNAIERLLGKTRQEIEQIAKDTLEGNLRGVLASLTPEQVNGDKLAFAKSLLEEAEDDLEQLGLILDTLQIQNISDDVGYLDSIGRQQRAELLRDARIAEAQAKADAAIRTAENRKMTELKKLETEVEVSKAEADRRVKDAVTKRAAVVAESESEIASEVVRTRAEVGVQKERIKQVEQKLQADVVAPAEAECKRAIARARGDASQIVEEGKAQSEGIRRLAESWKAAGSNAREIFLYQKLEVLLKTMASTVPDVSVDNVTIVDAGKGSTATKMAAFLEELRQTTGIDVAAAVQNFGGRAPEVPVSPATPPKSIKSSRTNGQAVRKSAAVPPPSPEESMPSLQTEVRQLLDRVAQNTHNNTEAEQAVEQALKQYPNFKRRLQTVLKTKGPQAVRTLFNHPTVYIPTAMLEMWLEKD
jgi:flotillin